MSPTEPTADWFEALMRRLVAHFKMIDLGEAVDRAKQRTLTGRTISVTFDDGYADNYTVALPILERLKIPTTFFVASGFLDGGRMWNDSIIETIRRLAPGSHRFDLPNADGALALSDWASRRQAAARVITAWKHLPPEQRQAKVDALAQAVDGLPDDLMMTSDQLRALDRSDYAAVGGHTRTHPILASLTLEQARDEITAGKRDLEQHLQRELDLFAYPNGKLVRDYRPEHADLVKQAGFRAAVATDWGTLDRTTDVYQIPRFTPWHSGMARFTIDLARCHHGLLGQGS